MAKNKKTAKKVTNKKQVSKKTITKSKTKQVSKSKALTKKPVTTKTGDTKKKKVIGEVKLLDIRNLKRVPFSHQIEAANFLLEKKKCILADDMGAGKTFSSILALSSIKGKRLIVCPASLKLNWQKEIRLVSQDRISIIEGKKWVKPTQNSWTIINYDILTNHMINIISSDFDVAAFDEVHYCKSVNNSGKPDSKRAKCFMRIANQSEYLFLLTGTPISNKTKDIFNLLKAIKHPLSKDFKAFAQRYCNPVFNGFGYSYDGSSNQEELNKLLQSCMLRRLKGELLELPVKTRSFIPVEINVLRYNSKIEEYKQNKSSFKHKGEHLMYLNAMRHELAKEKVAYTIAMAENLLEQNKPVVIFTNYTAVVEAFRKKFKNASFITGEITKDDRDDAVSDFQNGKTDIIICNLIAGGVGLTLTRAKNMLINDFDWVPTNHTQAEERIYRIGQNEDVIIEYVYGDNTFDATIANLLEEKLKNINLIIDGTEEGFLDEVIRAIS